MDESDPNGVAAANACLSAEIGSIAGGTSEIPRNITGERAPGLRRDRDPNADLSFPDRPRG